MIDLHTHVLPGIDDGPDTTEASIALAGAALRAGTSTVVATPHVNHRYSITGPALRAAVNALGTRLDEEGLDLRVLPGAEIAIPQLSELDDAALEGLGLGGGSSVLLESPYVPDAGGAVESAVFALQLRGRRVVLAHPERSPTFLLDPDCLRRLAAGGTLCSITLGSITGRFGRRVRRFTLELLREGLVHNVASDAHDTRRRPPDLGASLEQAASDVPALDGQVDWLTRQVPGSILADVDLPPRPVTTATRTRSRLWSRGRLARG